MRIKLPILMLMVLFTVITLLIFLIGSCKAPSGTSLPPSVDIKTATQAPVAKVEGGPEWEKTLALGKKEGWVTVYSTLGSEVRNAFIDAFPKATGIHLDFLAGRSVQISQKITMEYSSGVNMVDIYTGGLNTIIDDMMAKGYLQPIKPALILPEVTNPNMWINKQLNFADKNEDTIFSFRANPGGWTVTINTERVKKEDISSFYDLLNPKWKGKIALNDVTVAGSGQKWVSMALLFYGLNEDYMRQLAKQEPYMTRDERQQAEWVAHGKYPIGIAVSSDVAAEFRSAGAPILEISPKEEKMYLSTGGGNVVLFKKAPHPNAAKVFINWLLSKEGQTAFSLARQDASARVDVPTDHLPYNKKLDPNYKYIVIDKEVLINDAKYKETQDKAREIFGHLLK